MKEWDIIKVEVLYPLVRKMISTFEIEMMSWKNWKGQVYFWKDRLEFFKDLINSWNGKNPESPTFSLDTLFIHTTSYRLISNVTSVSRFQRDLSFYRR